MSQVLPPRAQERALLEVLDRLHGERIVCNTAGRAQLARGLAERFPAAEVFCHFFDLFQLRQTQAGIGDELTNLHFLCTSDLTAGPVDCAIFALSQFGEAELARDLMHSAYRALAMGGRLAVASDNPADTWLHGEMSKLFSKVSRIEVTSGIVYLGSKVEPIRKTKTFDCEVTFRDGDRLLRMMTRPGVFAHRRVDAGARQLMRIMEIQPGMRVLEIGCGSGATSLAAASRAREVNVLGIDSNPRAIECLLASARMNGLEQVRGQLDTDGATIGEESFDLVLANPPYFSHNRIAEIFVTIAHRSLRPRGKTHFVTKKPEWLASRLPELFTCVEVQPMKDYFVISAVKAELG